MYILRVYNERFPRKMVTIQRKNLFASCLFLLVHSFILAVSGSYDYSVSGLFANELESEKQDTEWLANHQGDLMKGNYVSRIRKSRSTSEENSQGEETEETNPKIRRKWKPRRKRKFKRSLLSENIENATTTINSTEDSFDAINNATMKEANGEGESIKLENSMGEQNNNETDLKSENGISKKNDGKIGFRSFVPRIPVDMNVVAEFQKRIIGTDLITLIKQFVKEILDRVDYQLHFRRKQMKEKEEKDQSNNTDTDKSNQTKQENEKGNEKEKEKKKEEVEKKDEKKNEKQGEKEKDEKKNEKQGEKEKDEKKEKEEDAKEKEKDEKKKKKDEKEEKDDKKEKDEKGGEKNKEDEDDLKKSEEIDRTTSIISSSDIKLIEIIPDVFLPTIKNFIFPWKALASKQYIMEVSKERGPHKKQTTKETKSKLSLFYVRMPNNQETGDKEQLENPSNLDDLKNKSEDHEKDNNDEFCELIKNKIEALKNSDIDENAVYEFIITVN